MKPVQWTEAERVGYVRRAGEFTGNTRVHQVFFHEGKWWDVIVVSAKYGVYNTAELPLEEPVWGSMDEAAAGLVALALPRSA